MNAFTQSLKPLFIIIFLLLYCSYANTPVKETSIKKINPKNAQKHFEYGFMYLGILKDKSMTNTSQRDLWGYSDYGFQFKLNFSNKFNMSLYIVENIFDNSFSERNVLRDFTISIWGLDFAYNKAISPTKYLFFSAGPALVECLNVKATKKKSDRIAPRDKKLALSLGTGFLSRDYKKISLFLLMKLFFMPKKNISLPVFGKFHALEHNLVPAIGTGVTIDF